MDEVQIELGQVIREIHQNYGGHLTSFAILCSKKEPNSPVTEISPWFGGAGELRFTLVIEAAKIALDQIMKENNCSMLEGIEVLKGLILARKLRRDKQARNPRPGGNNGTTPEYPFT